MKQYIKFCLVLLVSGLLLTGCGGGYSGSASDYNGYYDGTGGSSGSSGKSAAQSGISSAEGQSEGELSNQAADSADSDSQVSSEQKEETADGEKATENETNTTIDVEKIIYSGNIRVYTEEFDKTMDSLNQLISENEGFIENSTFRDGNASKGYSKEYSSNYSYEATIRVPSKNFNKVMNSIGDLGKASEKTTNAENVTQEYNDLRATLEVYEAQRERYMEQLKTTKDDSIALKLQEKILSLDTTIAQYKSRLSNIDNRVSYSSIHINIDEYYLYEEEHEEKESFIHKVGGVFKDAGQNILDLLLILLNFVLIWLVRILVFGVLIIVIVKLIIAILRFFGIVKSEQKFTLKNLTKRKAKKE